MLFMVYKLGSDTTTMRRMLCKEKTGDRDGGLGDGDGLASLPTLRIYDLYFVTGLNWPSPAGRLEVVAN